MKTETDNNSVSNMQQIKVTNHTENETDEADETDNNSSSSNFSVDDNNNSTFEEVPEAPLPEAPSTVYLLRDAKCM